MGLTLRSSYDSMIMMQQVQWLACVLVTGMQWLACVLVTGGVAHAATSGEVQFLGSRHGDKLICCHLFLVLLPLSCVRPPCMQDQ
jgi:hypothetical protein